METARHFRIITNNPLVASCMNGKFEVAYEDVSYREILIRARDLIHAGHKLYTHPLSGSVKPNETPYKSIVVSAVPGALDEDGVVLISNAVATYDKFPVLTRVYTDSIRRDFQLIDYTLLSGALDFDAVAGLSNRGEPHSTKNF